jgi:uncharacterized protein YabE (DUF348 family)
MRRCYQLAVYGAALTVIAGGTVTLAAVDKTVHLEIDAQPRAVHTMGGHVRDALAAGGYVMQAHDIVAPRPQAAIHNGSHVVVHRARLLKLSVDGGAAREVWTTQPTVQAALADLGYSTQASSSVSRDQRLPLAPTSIEIRSPKRVMVRHDGTVTTLSTSAATVGQLLQDAGIGVGDLDRLSVPASSTIKAGQQIVVQRIQVTKVIQAQAIPFAVQRRTDAGLDIGTTTVVAPGARGSKEVTYSVVYVDGRATARTVVATKVTKWPTPRVMRVGTRAVTPQQIAAQQVAAHGWGSDQMNCLTLLWDHESGWRVDAANADSGAYGIPQALPGAKMSAAGADWQTNARTQIAWGLSYISGVYGTPCGAWGHELDVNWY